MRSSIEWIRLSKLESATAELPSFRAATSSAVRSVSVKRVASITVRLSRQPLSRTFHDYRAPYLKWTTLSSACSLVEASTWALESCANCVARSRKQSKFRSASAKTSIGAVVVQSQKSPMGQVVTDRLPCMCIQPRRRQDRAAQSRLSHNFTRRRVLSHVPNLRSSLLGAAVASRSSWMTHNASVVYSSSPNPTTCGEHL